MAWIFSHHLHLFTCVLFVLSLPCHHNSEVKDEVTIHPIHVVKDERIIVPKNSYRRSIWDTIDNANISVENHVHSYTTTKSDIKQKHGHIKKHDSKRKTGVEKVTAKGSRRDVWDLINNANISIQNSVHSQTVRKFHHSKPQLHHVKMQD